MPQTNGLQFSPLIIGTMRLGVWGAKMNTTELERFIDQCLDLGLRDFDHADIYGHYSTEAEFGEVLARRPDLRSKMQITTKCGIKMISENRPTHKIKSYDSSRAHILASAENSLRYLNTEYIDLFLIHRPDLLMNIEEVAEAFSALKKAGKVRHFGVSNFSPSQVNLLRQATPLLNHQIEMSLTHLNPLTDGTLDQCQQYNIVPTAWSPLGGGSIFSKIEDPRLNRIKKTGNELAEKYNASLDQILLSWLRKHPAGVVPILGTSKIERVNSALGASEIELTREEWYELWQASTGEEVA